MINCSLLKVKKAINILITTKNDENRNIITGAISSQDDLRIVGIESDETSAVIKSERLKPDVLIMDLQPPGIDGAELAPIIHRRSPDTSIIIMCDRDEDDYASRAFRAGISGFMLRKADMNKLIPAVKIVNLGGYYISASITKRTMEAITHIRQFPGQDMENISKIRERWNASEKNLFLSSTERSIIKNIAKGFKDDEIAVHLNYSTGTIKNCIAAIKRKTNLRNRTQIVVFSLIYGFIKLDQLNIINTNGHILNDGIQ